jgi:hypothetical protein
MVSVMSDDTVAIVGADNMVTINVVMAFAIQHTVCVLVVPICMAYIAKSRISDQQPGLITIKTRVTHLFALCINTDKFLES